MSQEIEIKIPLDQSQYQTIKEILLGKKDSDGLVFSDCKLLYKRDEYFSRFNTKAERAAANEPKVIRLRAEKTEGGEEKSFLTVKNKRKKNGIEINEEQETFVENPDVIRNMFAQTGFNKWFSKEKDAVSAYCRVHAAELSESLKFHVELEIVNGLYYLEIEYTESETAVEIVIRELENLARLLGADPEKRDSRSWVEIIEQLKK